MQSNDQTQEPSIVIGSLAARLARSPAAEWRIDDEEAILILDALLDQINLSGAPRLCSLNAQYMRLLQRMRRFNQLNSWTAVFISALFAAMFMVDRMMPNALVAAVWAVIAALWARRIDGETHPMGGTSRDRD